jgi:hypothetical protein
MSRRFKTRLSFEIQSDAWNLFDSEAFSNQIGKQVVLRISLSEWTATLVEAIVSADHKSAIITLEIPTMNNLSVSW